MNDGRNLGWEIKRICLNYRLLKMNNSFDYQKMTKASSDAISDIAFSDCVRVHNFLTPSKGRVIIILNYFPKNVHNILCGYIFTIYFF